MKKLYFIIVCILFYNFPLKSQELAKGFKQLEKKNLSKAEKIFNEILAKDSMHCLANYGMALIYTDAEFQQKDYYKAFRYIVKADKNSSSINVADLTNVKEFFNTDSLEKNKGRIDDKLFESVKSQHKVEASNEFIKRCPESRNLVDMIYFRNDMEFDAAKSINTIDAFNIFVSKYPKSEQADKARDMRNSLQFAETKRDNTIEAYNKFIKKYPDARQIPEAKKIRNSLEYKRVKVVNTFEAYQSFLDKYPDAEESTEADRMRNAFAFDKAQRDNSLEAFDEFIKKYPKAIQVNKAIEFKAKLAHASVLENASIESLNKFLKEYKEGSYFQEVFNLKATTLVKDVEAQIDSVGGDRSYNIKVFDNLEKNDKAQQIAITSQDNLIVSGNTSKPEKWFSDAWIFKLDSLGNVIWSKIFGEDLDDELNTISVTLKGNIFGAGHYDSQNCHNGKVWIFKLDTEGKKVWSKTFAGTDALAIDATENEEPVVAGYTSLEDGNRDFWVTKLNKEGENLWTKTFKNRGIPNSVKITSSGDIIVSGENWMLKLNNSGGMIWENPFPDYCNAYSSKITIDGSILIAGRRYDFRDKVKNDFWVAKYDLSGKLLWDKRFDNANSHDRATSIFLTNTGDILLAGLTSRDNDKIDDVWIMCLDNSGKMKWDRTFKTTKNEKKPTIVSTTNGRIYILTSKGLDSDMILISL